MAEQTAVPGSGSSPDLPADTSAEDAGRLIGASNGRLIAILVALVLFSEIVTFQMSMISVIVPKIGLDFPQAGSSVTWTVTILGVVGGATMGLTGKLADLLGKKKMLVLCSVLFFAGCLICALTHNWALFLVGRGVASVSWGMSAIGYGIVRDLMPRRWIPICVGILGTGFGIAGVAGPIITGALTDHWGWRSVFWFLVIYMAVTIPFFLLIVPESPLRAKQRFDVLGATLFGVGVGAVLIYLSEGSNWGWKNMGNLAYLIGGIVALVIFVLWERVTPDPMMELPLLAAPKVILVLLVSFFITGVFVASSYPQAYMFQTPSAGALHDAAVQGVYQNLPAPYKAMMTPQVLGNFVHIQGNVSYGAGFSTLSLALHITMWSAVVGMIMGPIGGLICRQIGSRLPLIVGCLALAAAGGLLIPFHTTWQEQIAIGVLIGIGMGFFYASCPNLIMDAVPADRQGVAAGYLAVFGGIGTSAASALFTSIVSAHPVKLVVAFPGQPVSTTTMPQVYDNAGYSSVYLLLVVIPAVVGVLLAIALRTGRTPARGGEAVAAGVASGEAGSLVV